MIKSWMDLYTGQGEVFDTEEYVLAEDNEWKVYRLKDDFNIDMKIASNYNTLGMMYSYGKGIDADLDKSLVMFQNAIKYDDQYYYYYYGMSNTLLGLERLDEAEEAANKSIELLEEHKDSDAGKMALAHANNVLGVVYQRKGDKEKAKEYYNLALEYNPENTEAQQNLDKLQ